MGKEINRRQLFQLAALGAVEIAGVPLLSKRPTEDPPPKPLIKGRGRVYTHGSRTRKDIFLSVDDGWKPEHMKQALRTAEKYDIPLTFFPAGIAMKGNEELYKEIFARGHAIENHTYKHDIKFITRDTPKKAIIGEIKAQQEVLYEAIKPKTPDDMRRIKQRFFRPPGGNGVDWDERGRGIRTPFRNLVEACREMELDIATWDIDSNDWRKGADPYRNVMREINGSGHSGKGSFVLTHALENEKKALPQIIEAVLKRGLKPADMRIIP